MQTFFTFLGSVALAAGALCCLSYIRAENPQEVPAGVQTELTVELSGNQSVADYTKEGVKALGRFVPADTSVKEPLNFLLFIPKCESAKTEAGFPLLLFLHGAGERGDNIEAVKVHGPPMLVETDAKEVWPFVTVSPQCPEEKYWSPQQLLELLDYLEANYPIDPDRVYVTGLSMGGFGTWMLLALAPDRFAAAAPICGGGDPDEAGKMLDVPIWVYHGGSDSVVPVELSEAMVKAIWEKGGDKIKLTEYPGVDHNSWTQTYANPEFYKWLLKQNRAAR
ncbi:MAG: prolyl oligopeptidase family serine peptidase [Thermoguttaceae bacterium]|nr:prolyl oligopeptidase family serine peptidase [Thermoguttaceae bacterium]